jgi:DNA polymerase I-like protein with 3'-5' exonuclease and polymerase domains
MKLPNIRRIFVPDLGKVICDCDLSGADAQVVAWEANDHDLKHAFRKGLDVHNHNGAAMWKEAYIPDKRLRHHTMRDELKRAVHGTNYGSSVRNLASTLGWSTSFASAFQERWFQLHPSIYDWHKRINLLLATTRTITNPFGYRRVYFDRPENCFTEALAWGPQSTVALICSRGAVQLNNTLPWVEILLQVHDSIVFQIPFTRVEPTSLRAIRNALTVTVPYPSDPLVIPWGLAISEKSWGDVSKQGWPE